MSNVYLRSLGTAAIIGCAAMGSVHAASIQSMVVGEPAALADIICPKFTRDGGRQVFAFTAGDWNNPSVYHLTVVPLRLEAN